MIKLEIDMETHLRDLDMYFSNLKLKAITNAARDSLNRAATQTRNFSVKRMQEERKLAPASLKRRIFILRARGNELGRLTATVLYTGLPLPLLLFIKGAKKPIRGPGKGPRVFEIKKGSVKPKRGLFVAKAKHGKERYQVFRRREPGNSKKKDMVKQGVSSVVELFRKKRDMQDQIKNFASLRFQRNFEQALTFQLSRLK